MLKKLWNFFRRETVLSLAFILAVLSCFLVPPDGQYPGYLDKDTLLTLFCLMTVVAGFQGIDANGDITTLGRGGSDTTAVAVAWGSGSGR